MKYEAVLFDLDGTLLDTAVDLMNAVNRTLEKWGYPTVDKKTVVAATGNGAAELVGGCLPEGKNAPRFEELLNDYRAWYEAHYCDETAPYDGVVEVLHRLQMAGVKVAIISNKNAPAVKSLCDKFFPGVLAYGEIPGIPRKPRPDMLWKVLDELGAGRDRVAYVGDSEVDIATCRNARMDFVGVSWGFRGRQRLLQEAPGATVVDTAEELEKCLIDKA